MPAQLSPERQVSLPWNQDQAQKNSLMALALSLATRSSFHTGGFVSMQEKPTFAGDSMQTTLAFLFQAYLLLMREAKASLTTKGPCSYKAPRREEQPGPPLNQKSTGSVLGLFCEGKKKQCIWTVLSSRSRQPEYQGLSQTAEIESIVTGSGFCEARAKANKIAINTIFIIYYKSSLKIYQQYMQSMTQAINKEGLNTCKIENQNPSTHHLLWLDRTIFYDSNQFFQNRVGFRF